MNANNDTATGPDGGMGFDIHEDRDGTDASKNTQSRNNIHINEEYEQDLLERLTDIKRRMENKRLQNHVLMPFALMIMVFVYVLYPGVIIISLLAVFMAPSLLFNLIFILLPLYGKVYVVQKISFLIYKLIMFVIVLIYIINLVLVFGNLTLVKFTSINTGSLYICHFVIQIAWMWLHFQQMLTLYYWIQYMNNYNGYLLEATFIQSHFDQIDDDEQHDGFIDRRMKDSTNGMGGGLGPGYKR